MPGWPTERALGEVFLSSMRHRSGWCVSRGGGNDQPESAPEVVILAHDQCGPGANNAQGQVQVPLRRLKSSLP